MIKDLDLMYDISPLFEKKLVIWGVGFRGREILKELKDMGAGKAGIILCDSDENKCGGGQYVDGEQIISPFTLKKYLYEEELGELKNIIICVMVDDIRKQDEILSHIKNIITDEADIYTCFAVKWAIYYALNSKYIDEKYRQKKIIDHKREIERENLIVNADPIRYFAFAPLHNDELLLVYQPGKTGSSTVYDSILRCGGYALHTHSLRNVGYTDNDLRMLMNKKSGKIISLVREPISRTIASMWQNIKSVKLYSAQADFQEVENYYLKEGFEKWQFIDWFEREIKYIFGIDIYDYPFDKEKGYQIIKFENIELLLIKMEKLNDLESVIGEFLNMKDFKLESSNIGEDKEYRFAYQEYKKRFSISPERAEVIYGHSYIKHFYTEEERSHFLSNFTHKVG